MKRNPSRKNKNFSLVSGTLPDFGAYRFRQMAWLNGNWHGRQPNRLIVMWPDKSKRKKYSGQGCLAYGKRAGKVTQEKGGKYICDRGSSHIRFQNEVLKEEYARWKIPFQEIDPRYIEKEEAEYELADRITVPSEFVL